MPPRGNPRRFNTQATRSPPPPPPPQFDVAILQAVVTAAVYAAMEHYDAIVTGETGDGVITKTMCIRKNVPIRNSGTASPKLSMELEESLP